MHVLVENSVHILGMLFTYIILLQNVSEFTENLTALQHFGMSRFSMLKIIKYLGTLKKVIMENRSM
jgi:hypothetical protein